MQLLVDDLRPEARAKMGLELKGWKALAYRRIPEGGGFFVRVQYGEPEEVPPTKKHSKTLPRRS